MIISKKIGGNIPNITERFLKVDISRTLEKDPEEVKREITKHLGFDGLTVNLEGATLDGPSGNIYGIVCTVKSDLFTATITPNPNPIYYPDGEHKLELQTQNPQYGDKYIRTVCKALEIRNWTYRWL